MAGRELARSQSPTRALWDNRREAQKRIQKMSEMGLHIFSPDWGNTYHSSTFTEAVLKIFGGKETINIPVQTCTKVQDVKEALAWKAMCQPDQIVFIVKQGCTHHIQGPHEEIGRRVTVKGIKSFEPLPYQWPHAMGIIGCGYNGIKHALQHVHEGHTDFWMIDRYDKPGGHAWLHQANKTSKLQTEMGAFHIWFGNQFADKNNKLTYPVDWDTWPKADQIIEHMQHCVDRYGLRPYMRLNCDAETLDFLGKLTDHDRQYIVGVKDKKTKEDSQYSTSCLMHFPGAYFNPRIIDYPGEDTFGGQVGYGMNSDIPYDYIDGAGCAILGNGAFGVENIRTCCEYGCKKVYMICRKKNLPSPRMVCWFVHQAMVPVPAAMVLRCFQPMFEATGMGDPFEYHQVYGNSERTKVTIMSNSRFGIGDVTFLAVCWGRCEYVTDKCKRMTRHTIHTELGRKLTDVTVIIKALGLIADHFADKFHKCKEMIGTWIHGDYRRYIYADPTGMHAANFMTFSTGIGSYGSAVTVKYLWDFPQEFSRLKDTGILDMLPRQKNTDDRPAYQYDAKYASTCGMVVDANLPGVQAKMASTGDYMSDMMLAAHPLDKTMKECRESWDQYQRDWWKMGFDHPYTPYPYTLDMIYNWYEEYKSCGLGATSSEEKKQWSEWMAAQDQGQAQDQPVEFDVAMHKQHWMANDADLYYSWKKRGLGGGG